MTIAAVVLAAGASSRLGEPKQLLRDFNGEVLVHKVAREVIEAGLHPVVVVIGANATLVRDAVSDLNVNVEENERWSVGISSSIRAGVAAVLASAPETEGVLLLTCDMPSVGITHIKLMLEASESGRRCVASRYGDTIGIPAIILATEFVDVQLLQGDKGAKSLFKKADTAFVELVGGSFDLDTPEDVAKWRAAGAP